MDEIECSTCDNSRCFIKKYAIEEWLPVIGHHKPVYHLGQGQQVFEEGSYAEGIYFIYSGLVKVTKMREANKEYIIRLAGSGDILGHRGFGGTYQYPVSAITLEQTTICYFDKDWFYKVLKGNTDLLFNLMLFFGDELQKTESRMQNLINLPVKGRIAETLLMLEKAYGINEETGYLNTTFLRKELAGMAGTTYESVVRTLSNLQDEGVLELDNSKIKIKSRSKLEDLVNNEHIR